jgi:hypothetical protein
VSSIVVDLVLELESDGCSKIEAARVQRYRRTWMKKNGWMREASDGDPNVQSERLAIETRGRPGPVICPSKADKSPSQEA